MCPPYDMEHLWFDYYIRAKDYFHAKCHAKTNADMDKLRKEQCPSYPYSCVDLKNHHVGTEE